MSEQREIVCIACPIGCRLTVETSDALTSMSAPAPGPPWPEAGDPGAEAGISVRGNRCPRGEVYGREEILSPKRMVTAVVMTDSPLFPYASVRTDRPLPRPFMGELLTELYGKKVALPVARGQVMMENFRNTGVSVVFSRTLPPDEIPSPG